MTLATILVWWSTDPDHEYLTFEVFWLQIDFIHWKIRMNILMSFKQLISEDWIF